MDRRKLLEVQSGVVSIKRMILFMLERVSRSETIMMKVRAMLQVINTTLEHLCTGDKSLSKSNRDWPKGEAE